jgi:hypothetical protein
MKKLSCVRASAPASGYAAGPTANEDNPARPGLSE